MRTRSLSLLFLVGCAYEPVNPPAPVPAPSSPGAPPVAEAPEVEAPTWKKHRCARSVRYPAYTGTDTPPAKTDEYTYEGNHRGRDEDPANPAGVGGNYTLDEKLAALNKKRKDEGSCDTRHRDAVETSILKRAAPTPALSSPTRPATDAFENAGLVTSVLALTPDEEKRLASDGLVVSEHLGYANYTAAYYDIHRGQLPVYVTVDSILHAIYASHATYLGAIEQTSMIERLDTVLGQLHCALPGAAGNYSADIANDLDLYLTVARSLLANQPVYSELGKVDTQAAQLVEMLKNPSSLVTIELFGRERGLDTTQFTPRGHYADGNDWSAGLSSYFRASMWLSRIDLNLVSRDTRASTPGYDLDGRETPREAMVAVALADLAQRAGAVKGIEALDRAWGTLAGKREDVSVSQLLALTKNAKLGTLDESDAPALRKSIGAKFVRTVNVGPTPNVKNLPVIATLLGARITPDTAALGELVAERGPSASAVELGYMLGSDRARAYIKNAASIDSKLSTARSTLASAPLGADLYSKWLTAIRELATPPKGAKPSFMETPAFADLRLNTMLTGYGQLRHNHVLVAAQAYDQGGCEIPDGYVEPAPATYAALADYARHAANAFRSLDKRGGAEAIKYFTRVEKLMKVLVQISREELANRPLSNDAKRFLAMIVERRIANAKGYMDTYPVATFDGWYLDLFPNIDTALESPAFISDFATFDRDGQQGIHYLGAKAPRLGVFVVDTGGSPRLMVGPVARAFQHTGELAERLDDSHASTLSAAEPWAASYTVAAPPLPEIRVQFRRTDAKRKGTHRGDDTLAMDTVRITSSAALGDATVELLDHHFVKMGEVTLKTRAGSVDVKAPTQPRPIEALRVRIGGATERYDIPLEGVLDSGRPAAP